MSACRVWKFVVEKPAVAAFVLVLAVAVISGLWAIFQENSPAAPVDTAAIVELLLQDARKRERELKAEHQKELATAHERETELRKQLTEAVEALKAEGTNPEAPAGIEQALDLLGQSDTAAAEAIFEEIKARRKAEGAGALKEAAAAARHIGALAFLHDTDKALAAYREAVALVPENPDGWNRFGRLLFRSGDLDGVAEAYNRVLSLGNRTTDQSLIAVATGNLGILYAVQGNLDDAEDMFRKSRELYEALGRKEGMASNYGDLGFLYQTRGELDRAEEMYRKSLELFREIGAAPMIEKMEGWLAKLREAE